MNKSIWTKKIRYIETLKDEDLIKVESYSILVSFILSKDVFKLNADLYDFMCDLGIECKPYLMKSRTALLGRAIRVLQYANMDKTMYILQKIKSKVNEIAEVEHSEPQIDKKRKDNYMKKMLDLYGRKE